MKERLEELLDSILTCSPDGYIASDEYGKVILVNEVIEKITGWCTQELIGQEVSRIYTLPEGESFLKPQVAFLNRRDGEKVTIKARQIEIKNKNEKGFKGYLIIFHPQIPVDSNLDKAQEEFVSTVSHELRTPLTSIRGFAETLLKAGDKLPLENQRKYMKIIKDQADRLTRLVEDLLAVSRLESQSPKFEIRALDLKRAINKVCDSLGSKLNNRKIVQDIEENIPNVWADADKLEQILTNLVDNAIKYSPDSSTITVKVASVLNDQNIKDKLKIEVTDEGLGIKESDIPKIFTKFGRVDNPLTRQQQGTGLGLFITKSLVLSLRGDISVKSKPGETSFTVMLPAVVPSQAIPLTSSSDSTTFSEK